MYSVISRPPGPASHSPGDVPVRSSACRKPFHRGIIVAVTSPTHERGQAEQAQLILIVLGTNHQIRRHPDPHRMAKHLSHREILGSDQIEPASAVGTSVMPIS